MFRIPRVSRKHTARRVFTETRRVTTEAKGCKKKKKKEEKEREPLKSHPSNRVYAREHPTYVQCETNSSKDGKPMKPRAEERGAVTIGERSLLFFFVFYFADD